MKLVLEQELPCTPEVAWLYVTSPSHMARWSLAAVRPLDVGDGGGMDCVGALREVSIQTALSRTAFTEVIEHAERPERLVYRVIQGLPVRYHRGEITLRPTGPGHTLLRWQVNADFLWPGAASVARPLLEKQLRESLRQLARGVRPEPVAPPPAPRGLVEEQHLPSLYTEASLCLDEQHERLLSAFPRGTLPPFLRVLRAVTPDPVREAYLSARYYDVRQRYREAFERAARQFIPPAGTSPPAP
jgi:uncharacterized protein YndB with AHSA1/START domain